MRKPKRSAKQRAATRKMLAANRRARKGRRRARRSARKSHRRRVNPGQPVILVNPSSSRRKPMAKRSRRRRRRSSGRRRAARRASAPRRRRRRSAGRRRMSGRRLRRRRNPTTGYRRRNPTSKWGQAFMSTFLGLVTGAVAYGVNYGVEYIPVEPLWRTVIFGAGGFLGSLGLAKWGSPTIGAGFGGGVGALLTGRVVTQIRLHQVAPAAPKEGGAVFARNPRMRGLRDAGRVYTREGGAVYQRDAGAATTMRAPVFGRGFKEGGASRFVAGPVRFYGPQSWAYGTEAAAPRQVRYVSAHNRR